MTRFLSFLFLCIYLTNQAAYALPGLNNMSNTIEFKKKCKFGRKETLLKYKTSSDSKTQVSNHQKSVKKIVSYCFADAHISNPYSILFFIPTNESLKTTYKIITYVRFSNINSPPPCIGLWA